MSVGSASGLPTGTTNFYVAVKPDGSSNTEEIFQVTNVTGTTLTVAGAQAGTSASNHSTGALIVGSIMTAAAYSQYKTDVVAAQSPITTGPSAQTFPVRVYNTVYQNTATTVRWVSITNYMNSTGNVWALCDSASNPSTTVTNVSWNAGYYVQLFFAVLPSYYYKVTYNTSASITYWVEYQ
jgi:hypothetical protein